MQDKKTYVIKVLGCDESTTVALSLTLIEHRAISRLIKAVNKVAVDQCMPTMEIEEYRRT